MSNSLEESREIRIEGQALVDAMNAELNRIFGTSFDSPTVRVHDYIWLDYAYSPDEDEILIPSYFIIDKGEPMAVGTIAHEMMHRFRHLTGLEIADEERTALINAALIEQFGDDVLERMEALESREQALSDSIARLVDNPAISTQDLFSSPAWIESKAVRAELKPFRDAIRNYENLLSSPEECAADSGSYLLGYGAEKTAELQRDFGRSWFVDGTRYSVDITGGGEHPSHAERIAMLTGLISRDLAPNTIISFDEDCNILSAETGQFVPDATGQLQWQKQ